MRPPFCKNFYSYTPRISREVRVGKVAIGGTNPIRIQSMLTCDTMDTTACIQQTLDSVNANCEIVRITAPTVKDAANLQHIKKGLLDRGCDVPLVADIHFKPETAFEAAKWVEKIRINPGNFADRKKFAIREYTDSEYASELERLREVFTPLVHLCKDRGVAMRIGTNHGSLSDRIMNRYGDTPLGMVESALEFARIARDLSYHDFVFSMKASNPKVMIAAYRLLTARLEEEGPDWNYPIHLGVTEAGDGEDGRIKGAIGIGSLLHDGIGDTIRVSLTEDSVYEIPVANALIKTIHKLTKTSPTTQLPSPPAKLRTPNSGLQTPKTVFNNIALGGNEPTRVVTTRKNWDALSHKIDRLGDYKPELVLEDIPLTLINPLDSQIIAQLNTQSTPQLVTIPDSCNLPVIFAFRLLADQLAPHHLILLKDTFKPNSKSNSNFLDNLLESAVNLGSLLCDGIGEAVIVRSESAPGQSLRLAYNILQAAGTRIFKTDYVACPSCGRTLFDLQSTTTRIKEATQHLKGVRIAIMGCIVNGPGEMADADFGYVGGAPGKINLYVGKTPVRFNIPSAEAVDRLIDLIKEHNRWVPKPADAQEFAGESVN